MAGSLLLIGGPTAAGKTAAAIRVAKAYDAVVVSADAMQVYRGFDIGTAKPTLDERQGVLHLGIDVVEADADFSVADFRALVERAQVEHERVIVAGGTHFYLSALVRPMAPLPAANLQVRCRLEALDDPHAELARVDPVMARRLHRNDRVRVVRALEVFALAGRPMSEIVDSETPAPVAHVAAWIDRDDLAERIGWRLRGMVEAGMVEETARLRALWPDSCRPLQSFGYRHFVGHARGELSLGEAVDLTARDTRRFARKQRTWGRNLGWETTNPGTLDEAARRAFDAA